MRERPYPSRRSKRIRNVAFELCECRLLFTTYPLTSVPALYSRPSAPATIYLDFTGAPASTWNGISVPTTPAFDIDGDPTTFSSQELTDIQQIWAIVAEAYSPFNVDVTTVDPEPVTHNYLVNQSMRIVIGGSNTWSGTNDGGVSVDGSFSESFLARTSYVFSNEFAGNVFELGEIASHEAGHEFGLDIQSAYSGTTQTAYFNPGNSLEAPIMGVSYYSQRGVWWDGPTEASSTTIQDDMAVISSSTNGFGYAPLTVGQTIATATPLTISAGSATASGVIEQTTQTDYYSFATTGGSVTLNVNVAPYGAMLHAEEQIVNSSGTVIATADNANTLGQTITANLTAGTYHLVVGSYGQYGDVGQYTVTGMVPQFAAQTGSMLNIYLSGAGQVTLGTSGATVTAKQNGTQFSFSGITGITVADTGNSDVLNFNGLLALPFTFVNCGSSTANVNSGTLNFAANMGGTINLGNLSVANGAIATITAATTNSPTTLALSTLSIGPTGQLDVTNNQVLINYGSVTPISMIANWIDTGYAGGAWNGYGIISSIAQTNSNYGLGYADAGDANNPANLPAGEIKIMYTLLGDANLDGMVNAEDFTLFSHNRGLSGMMWDDGDFNYDGTMNSEDFTLLSDNSGVAAQIATPLMQAPPVVTAASTIVTTGSTDNDILSTMLGKHATKKHPWHGLKL